MCVYVFVCMYACVYMLARLLMTSCTIWHDMWTPYDWLNEFYAFNKIFYLFFASCTMEHVYVSLNKVCYIINT